MAENLSDMMSLKKLKQMITNPQSYLIDYFSYLKTKVNEFYDQNDVNLKLKQDLDPKREKQLEIIKKCELNCLNNNVPNKLKDQIILMINVIEKNEINNIKSAILTIKHKIESYLLSNQIALAIELIDMNKILLVEQGFNQIELENLRSE